MPKFVQEKFQVNPAYNPNDDGGGGWVSKKRVRTEKGVPHGNNALFNSLPPGMDINDSETFDTRVFNWSLMGNRATGHNAGDRTQDVTAKSLKMGFDVKECCPTDDMYTREHNDAFYEQPDVDGEHGFVERNNYLDRL